MRKFLVVTQLFYFFAFIESLTIDEDYDANSRNPYSYKYSIDDPESDTNFEASESGDPEVVRGSYRIALPDGRIQTVTYEAHPLSGYKASVSYSGTAQYPDRPFYRASPYGPPKRVKQRGLRREIQPVDEMNRLSSKRVALSRRVWERKRAHNFDLVASASNSNQQFPRRKENRKSITNLSKSEGQGLKARSPLPTLRNQVNSQITAKPTQLSSGIKLYIKPVNENVVLANSQKVIETAEARQFDELQDTSKEHQKAEVHLKPLTNNLEAGKVTKIVDNQGSHVREKEPSRKNKDKKANLKPKDDKKKSNDVVDKYKQIKRDNGAYVVLPLLETVTLLPESDEHSMTDQQEKKSKTAFNDTIEDILETIFVNTEKESEVEQVRIPKQIVTKNRNKKEYTPVHRDKKVRLVFKDQSFVPEYTPQFR